MKELFVQKTLNLVTKDTTYNVLEIKKLKYGIEGLYVTITKFIITFLIAILTNSLWEYLLFTLIYSPLRIYGYGLHASKSWMCWATTIPTFNLIPLLCAYLIIPFPILIISSLLSALIIIIYAPADTKKRPMKNREKYHRCKIICGVTTIIYLGLIILNIHNIINNAIFFALILQAIMVNPITYKIFRQSYSNYKRNV